MNPENVVAEFQRAGRALRAAQILQEERLFEDAISRAYYSVMHAARAALLLHDAIPESHSAVRRMFGSVMVRSGRIEEEWAAILAREQDRRITADYGVHVTWEPEASQKLVQDAAAFVKRIQKYLLSAGISLEV